MIRLRPRPALQWLPALAALAVVSVGLWAGNWQSGRALEKDELEARAAGRRDAVEVSLGAEGVDAASVDGRRLVARGQFIGSATIFWDNRFVGRTAGMAVITPLRLAGSERIVLVDRGIVPPGTDRSRQPLVATPPGVIEIRGRAYLAPRRTLELKDNADTGWLWQNLTPEKFAARSGMATHPFVLRQTEGPVAEGLLRGPDQAAPAEAGMTAAKHRGYAFQWYSLALLTLMLFLFFTFFRNDKPSRDT